MSVRYSLRSEGNPVLLSDRDSSSKVWSLVECPGKWSCEHGTRDPVTMNTRAEVEDSVRALSPGRSGESELVTSRDESVQTRSSWKSSTVTF